ncbi:MAG: ATP-binding protein [bacterium]|nr:ATP-binding protein [bacterium]
MKMALIEFSVENFKIFKNKVTFSTVARKSDHTFDNNGENLLKTSLIYGPNASGKSTLLGALTVMRTLVLNSATIKEGAKLPYHKFLLSSEKDLPIAWEIVFSMDEKIFKYSFSILSDKILKEILVEVLTEGKEKEYLVRNEQSIKLFDILKKSEDVISKTRKDVLFLSAASQWNDSLAITIAECFKNITIISGQRSERHGGFTVKLFKENPEVRAKILTLLKKADFCIDDGAVEQIELPEKVREHMMLIGNQKDIPNSVDTINFSHAKFNSEKENVGFEKINMGNESMGTQKFFDILGPIIDTLENDKILFIDEFDNSLHPFLTKFIVDIFEKNNPKNAQLIVTTHDTSLLSYKDDFDKSQIWFTEKDKFGIGNLFSLAEFKLRNDTEYSKKYLEGRFGALPFIESL